MECPIGSEVTNNDNDHADFENDAGIHKPTCIDSLTRLIL
jgi:hypothetical protein